MNSITQMVRPSLRVARVVYCTDLTRSGSRVIPLGIFGEIRLSHGYMGLGLKARSALSAAEMALIAPIFKTALANPFSYLAAEFDLAWAHADSRNSALDFLTMKHTAALSVLAPSQPAIERAWYRGLFREPEVEAKLKSAVSHEFDTLLADVPGDTPAPKGDAPVPVVRLQLAAAA
jgi:hypothetical protein